MSEHTNISSNSNDIIPGVILSDYHSKYSNKWYHSIYDSYYNSLDMEQICMTATLVARVLYKLAIVDSLDVMYNETYVQKYINGDCTLVEQLMQCLLVDMDCNLVNAFASSVTADTHYSGEYRIIEDDAIEGTADFVFRFVANLTKKDDVHYHSCNSNSDCYSMNERRVCSSDGDERYCMASNTYFHASVDPYFEFEYGSKNRFSIEDGGSSLFWTQSTWMDSNIGSRFFRIETDDSQLFMLVFGVVMFFVSFIVVYQLKMYCKKKFPHVAI